MDKLISILLVSIMVAFASRGYSQVSAIRDGNGNIANLHQMKITPVLGDLQSDGITENGGRLNYAHIKGSPFLWDEWEIATLHQIEKNLGTIRVRLNLATHELHFKRDDEELVLSNEELNKIVFHRSSDSVVFIKHPDLLLNRKKLNAFMQVLNEGNFQLLKYTLRVVGEADSLFGTRKRYFFKDEVAYYIKANEKIDLVKRLNKENIFLLIPTSSQHKDWIKSHLINFKIEEDVIKYLSYFNSKLSKEK